MPACSRRISRSAPAPPWWWRTGRADRGLTALNQLVRAKPDGLTMMMLNGEGAVMSQLIKQAGVAYDMIKVSTLGRVAHRAALC